MYHTCATSMHVLGIDAGGTKTVCQLADEHGAVIAETRGGGANLRAAGSCEVERVFRAVIEDILRSAHTPSASA